MEQIAFIHLIIRRMPKENIVSCEVETQSCCFFFRWELGRGRDSLKDGEPSSPTLTCFNTKLVCCGALWCRLLLSEKGLRVEFIRLKKKKVRTRADRSFPPPALFNRSRCLRTKPESFRKQQVCTGVLSRAGSCLATVSTRTRLEAWDLLPERWQTLVVLSLTAGYRCLNPEDETM